MLPWPYDPEKNSGRIIFLSGVIMSSPIQNVGYGLTNALQGLAPQPVLSTRNPLTTDKGFEKGTLWDNTATNQIWVLSNVVNSAAIWVPFSQQVGATSTTPLSVNAYASGTTAAATASATVNARYGQVAVLNVPALLAAGGGTLALTVSNTFFTTSTSSVIANTSILDASGNHAAMAIYGTIISAGQATFLLTNFGAGVPGANDIVYLNFQVPLQPALATTAANITMNTTNGMFSVTGKVTAGGATFSTVLTNSYITATSPLLVSVANLNASGNNAFVEVYSVVQAAGTATITIRNNSATALGAGDNVLVSILVPQLTTNTSGASAAITNNSVNSLNTVTGLNTAQNATISFVLTDSYITTSSALFQSVSSLNASANGALLSNSGMYHTAGSYTLVYTNIGAGALGAGDNVLLTSQVLS